MNDLIQLVPIVLGGIGALAFITSIIIQVIKALPVFDKLPTDLLVFCVSIIITVALYLGWSDYAGHIVSWYEIAAIIIGGIVVAYIAMFGWERFYELWQRFQNKKK